MNADWKVFLTNIAIGSAIGLVTVLLLQRARPKWMDNWNHFVERRRWKWFAFSALFFGSAAVLAWRDGSMPTACAGIMVFVMSVVALIRQGFLPLPPIESSDDVS